MECAGDPIGWCNCKQPAKPAYLKGVYQGFWLCEHHFHLWADRARPVASIPRPSPKTEQPNPESPG
jgi:hypothetical protein